MFAGREPAGGVDRVLDSIPPAADAEVMGTGIVSVALSLDGDETLSRTLLVIAAPMWVTLAVLVPMRAGHDRVRFLADQQSSRAGAVTGVGVERGRPGDGSLELTADVAAGESEMTRRVRQQQPAAAPAASNRGRVHENAVAPDRSAVSLLHLAEQAPAEVVGAFSQLVPRGSGRAGRSGRRPGVRIAHIGEIDAPEVGRIARDFRKRCEGKGAGVSV
jgi:hypothetical protein